MFHGDEGASLPQSSSQVLQTHRTSSAASYSESIEQATLFPNYNLMTDLITQGVTCKATNH